MRRTAKAQTKQQSARNQVKDKTEVGLNQDSGEARQPAKAPAITV